MMVRQMQLSIEQALWTLRLWPAMAQLDLAPARGRGTCRPQPRPSRVTRGQGATSQPSAVHNLEFGSRSAVTRYPAAMSKASNRHGPKPNYWQQGTRKRLSILVQAHEVAAAGARDNDRDRPLCRGQPAAARSGPCRTLLDHYGCQDNVANRNRRAAPELAARDP